LPTERLGIVAENQPGRGFWISPHAACNVARAAGLPEDQIRATRGREDIDVGAGVARGIPSRHGKVYFGRIPLPGEILEPPPWPPRFTELRHGLVLNWHVELAGVRVVHVDSADFIEEEMEGLLCDVLCLCAIGRKYRPDYTKTALYGDLGFCEVSASRSSAERASAPTSSDQ
jgi:hypothetical protein